MTNAMSGTVHHLKSRRLLLGGVAAAAVVAVAGLAATHAWGQSTATTAALPVATPVTGSPATTPSPPTTAPSGDQLTVAKTRVDLRVDRQLAAIDRASARMAAKADLNPSQRSTVGSDLGTLRSGLVALKAKVDAETSVEAVRADVKAARLAAKTNPGIEVGSLYVRADGATAYLDAVSGRVATIQSKLKASAPDAAAVNNAISDIQAKVADARGHLSGFDSALLVPTPPTPAQVSAATTGLKSVATDLTAIRKDVRSIRQARAGSKASPAGG
jgi:hypothetical protein